MLPNMLHVGVVLSLTKPSVQTTNINASYIGAVVEYHPVTDGDDGQMIAEANANNYRAIIKSASAYKVDIIVFPEYGLTSIPKDGTRVKQFSEMEYRAFYRDTASNVPDPNETVIICDDDGIKYTNSLKSISCAARDYQMYVVVNHHERVDCPEPNCASDGFLLYNTNVVFDRTGRVVARYRKYNLFSESGANVTAQPEVSIFTTDFGVTFGQLICFDIVNEKPASFFDNHLNVTDIVYSTHWYDMLPFFTSVEIQASWSYIADVNLLASSYSDATTDSGGSGIYAGRSGPIRTYFPRQTANALLVAEIPKFNRNNRKNVVSANNSKVHVFKQAEVPTVTNVPEKGRRLNSTFLKLDFHPYTTQLLDPNQGSHITTLCDRGLCCDFHIEMRLKNDVIKSNTKQYKYRMAVFNGTFALGNVTTIGTELCFLVACTTSTLESCGELFSESTDIANSVIFDSLIITRRADLSQRNYYMPSATKNELELMDTSDFTYISSGQKNMSLLLIYLVRPTDNLLTFGIHGRNFDKDGQPKSEPSSAVRTSFVSTTIMHTLSFLMLVSANTVFKL